MKLKFIVPYLIVAAGTAAIASASSKNTPGIGETKWTEFHTSNTFTTTATADMSETVMTDAFLEQKADSLCGHYVTRMLTAQQKLAPYIGTAKYRGAVRQELPGAPVGMHCVYGQYTHLTRALREMGDTLTIIPGDGSRSCAAFRATMTEKYSDARYAGCIHSGTMYPSDRAYNAALEKYLARRRITATSPDSLRVAVMAEFARNNFSIDTVSPGAILVVPRHRGSHTQFHAIMYPGRGRIDKNGQFIADSTGIAIYSAHNKERLGDLFETWDTSNVFAVDTKQIAKIAYATELQRVENMPDAELIGYLGPKTLVDRDALTAMSRPQLQHLARQKYFNHGQDLRIPRRPLTPQITTAVTAPRPTAIPIIPKLPIMARANPQRTR
ncbi:MAG: hypothetical protein K2L94_02060 [Alphaproteobacteria bacterium]|nr:hypothetical protein [Alphaproteobacteria bacterium]